MIKWAYAARGGWPVQDGVYYGACASMEAQGQDTQKRPDICTCMSLFGMLCNVIVVPGEDGSTMDTRKG
jgi:hypothetical protein